MKQEHHRVYMSNNNNEKINKINKRKKRKKKRGDRETIVVAPQTSSVPPHLSPRN